MAKRFTDTDKWKKPFIRGLEAQYKLLWFYILDDCDHAGIWIVDLEVAGLRCGYDFNELEVKSVFNKQIEVLDGGDSWFIRDFIDFQYGTLSPENRAHNSVIKILSKKGIKPLISPLQGDKDMDKDKDKEQSKEKEVPEFAEFLVYATSKKPLVDVEELRLKYESWLESGWKTNTKPQRPIKNWKSTLLNTLPHIKETIQDFNNFDNVQYP